MIQQIENYANHVNANNEIISWIKTTGRKAILKELTTESDLEHIIDFFISDQAPIRLQKMSFSDAKRKAKEWSEKNQKKGRNLIDRDDELEIVHDFLNGTKIVKLLTKKAFEREGFLMNHCVGGYNPSTEDLFVYSYRDEKNQPHATFEVRKNGREIVQIKGKGNGPIHPKYIYPILAFLKTIGIEIRPNDMKNLGYYHVHKYHVDFLKKTPAWEQVTIINGDVYAHD